jgi:hypothetical protein
MLCMSRRGVLKPPDQESFCKPNNDRNRRIAFIKPVEKIYDLR